MTTKGRDFSDGFILALYRLWSEGFYCAGFMHPDEHTVKRFHEWLNRTPHQEAQEDYEREMLRIFRSLEEESAVGDRDPVE